MTRSLVLHDNFSDSRPQVLETELEQVEKIIKSAQPGAVSTNNRFVYFAAFDGSNNDLANDGNAKNTNVAQLWTQYISIFGRTRPNIDGNYFPGPGAKGTLTDSSWRHTAVTRQVIQTAEDAYQDFAVKASFWLKTNPGGSVTTVLTSFSRGVASAAIFSQMLYERGLIDDKSNVHKVLVAPGQISVSAGIIFDPVATGVSGNLAFAPNVSNIVSIRAQDEYRQLFKAVDYSAQSCVKSVPMLGNHCDIGGSYENDGISGLTLEAATTFLANSGLPIGPLAPSRKFDGRVEFIDIHSEDAVEGGAPESKWSVYSPGPQIASFRIHDDLPSPRLSDPHVMVKPATGQVTADGSAGQAFLMYNGATVTSAKPAGAGTGKR